MNTLKALVLGLSLALVSACSTMTSNDGMDGETTSATEAQLHDLEHKVGDRIFFEFDSSAINEDAQMVLKKQAAFMAQNAELSFMIEGHCDERGTREYNLGLGERRANAVKQYLMSLGVEGSRLQTVSYGKERPAVLGSNEWAWGQNRRGVTVPR